MRKAALGALVMAGAVAQAGCAAQTPAQPPPQRHATKYCVAKDGFPFETSFSDCAPLAREVSVTEYQSLKERRDQGERGSSGTPPTAQTLKTNSILWGQLTEPEQTALRARYEVIVAVASGYGTVIDAQVVNESTPGTSGGAALGSALGSAQYVDNAFKGPRWNYSATSHLGASLLGAFAGSAFDQPAQSRFYLRYTLKMLDGEVRQTDSVSDRPFRQPVGVCVSYPAVSIVPQSSCDTDVSAFRAKYLPAQAAAKGLSPAKGRSP